MPNPEGSDDGEWIELYNNGSAAVSVEGWQLSAGTKDFASIDVILPVGSEVPAKGFFVIGAEYVEEADVIVTLSLGNGTDGDGVRLFDCAGTSVDTALYGDEENEDGMLDDNDMAPDTLPNPSSNQSVARIEDGVDKDEIEDWDSLNHINLVSAIEKEFKIKFAFGELVTMKDVGTMIDIILIKTND